MIRITGGEWKGRGLATPPSLSTRPTQARLRQALFNSIQFQISDAKVLDLFSGSGALAFEALSRGAAEAVAVENHRGAVEAIKKNQREFKTEGRLKLLAEDVGDALVGAHRFGPYDIVFADPPYAEGWELRLLEDAAWSRLLAPEGLFLLEWGTQKSKIEAVPDHTEHLDKIREKVYGDSVLSTYRRKP